MFYEEKLIDGIWFWRGTPTGTWISFTPVQYVEKIAALTARVTDLEAEVDRLSNIPGRYMQVVCAACGVGWTEDNHNPRFHTCQPDADGEKP